MPKATKAATTPTPKKPEAKPKRAVTPASKPTPNKKKQEDAPQQRQEIFIDGRSIFAWFRRNVLWLVLLVGMEHYLPERSGVEFSLHLPNSGRIDPALLHFFLLPMALSLFHGMAVGVTTNPDLVLNLVAFLFCAMTQLYSRMFDGGMSFLTKELERDFVGLWLRTLVCQTHLLLGLFLWGLYNLLFWGLGEHLSFGESQKSSPSVARPSKRQFFRFFHLQCRIVGVMVVSSFYLGIVGLIDPQAASKYEGLMFKNPNPNADA